MIVILVGIVTEVLYYAACSLDGYIATADGGVGWLDRFQSSGDDYGFNEFYSSLDSIVMGSKTYEFALTHGPWRSADKSTWVFTRRDLQVAHPSVTLTSEDPEQVMDTIRDRGLKHVWLMGGGELAASFRVRGLISHYMIAVIPVVLGGGIRLFADGGREDSLKLVEAKTSPSGIVQLNYEAVRSARGRRS